MDRSEPPPEVAEGEDFGYRLFPERHSEAKLSFLTTSLFTFNHKCQVMLRIALDTNPYAQLLLDAMKQSGCTVYKDRHFACEDCDGCVSGGFDSATSQIVLCQNNIHQQSHMNRVVTHELIHAFDHCRAHVDWFKNVKHLACSETCVRDRAIRSILAVRKVSKETAEKAVDEVFDSCFNDHEPFGRVPHSKSDAKYAYRDFQNRNRYYANL
nr:mitochondrial inner membrane protease ATP23 homolog isoform X2 [Pelodiscus sinensis]|eukprot:XP_014430695.1 mitochondrial inner membrane protease ATP23 homolog isoform X2 [Pelodiscus sinensis]